MSAEEEGGGGDGIPFYLMPVAAVFGMYSLYGGIRIVYLLYSNWVYNKEKKDAIPPPSLTSRVMIFWIVTVVASVLAYGKVVASVEFAMAQQNYSLFDPFDILGISEEAELSEIKKAYRSLSKLHHPDKGGDEDKFLQITNAYRALTDQRDNFDRYGHPDGPLQSRTLSFALPEWLLYPKGTVAVVLLVLYLGMFVALIYVVLNWARGESKRAKEVSRETSVAGADAAYLASKLKPTSTHFDILLCIATTPENVHLAQQQIDKVEQMKREKMSKEKKKEVAFDIDDGEWAQDDDEDEATKAAQKEEENRAKQQNELKHATGNVPLEGVDDGVLGQKWVEETLAANGRWPLPDLSLLDNMTFSYKNRTVSAMKHPAIRRNLCMMAGRLNSVVLNTHQDLLEASSKGKIDQTYFRASMEYRQRVGILLEACLRIAVGMQSYRLAKTVIETVSMFKIGVDDPHKEQHIKWFNSVMRKQYGSEQGLPHLKLDNFVLETPDEPEIATGDLVRFSMHMVRTHAEVFTKVKVAMCQKQGIPPQVALQSYREGWWILIRAKKLDGGATPKPELAASPLLKLLQDADKQTFDDEMDENRLLTAWPVLVQNMTHKEGDVKVQFKAPSEAGKYKFFISVKSQEFLGADQEFELEKTIVDVETLERKEDEEEEKEKEGGDEEKDEKEDEEDTDDEDDEPKKEK